MFGPPSRQGVTEKPVAFLRQSKRGKPLFRQGYVKLLRCIYIYTWLCKRSGFSAPSFCRGLFDASA
ncbi:hypothetical conserved protein [Geobacillus kaustophilus HTA426]|uniref:Hypothetical conserved protein n=1 Tax=Geobacillus kaustophilus (strain HTA426) TaxID=235909 RepID=Q5KUI4_GEOKA|nr:hypothetical conserved protein [Geobacillus kaustophilus HTA426]